MKLYMVIIVIAIIIFIVAIFRNEIAYFFALLNVTLKNRKSIKDLQNKGVNRRNISNKSIKEYVDFSYEMLDKRSIPHNKKFVLDKTLENRLIDSRFAEKYVQELLNNILDYLDLDKSLVTLKVNYLSSKTGVSYVGLYKEQDLIQDKIILINIKNDMNIYNVVSILAHESIHYLLLSNNIKLNKTLENECLTDITTLTMGFGKYMKEGYKISNRLFNDGENMVYVDKDRVGYLTSKDIEYALKLIK